MDDDDPLEADVEDIAKLHYNQQIEQLKYEQNCQDEEKDEEILELKKLLAEQKRKAEEAIARTDSEQMAIEEKKDPIVQVVTMNGVRSKLLICDFQPGKGRIGILFKRYGSQFFIIDTVANTQISNYKGIGPGLLLYQCISFAPGTSNGINISVQHSEELAIRVLQEFGKGRSIQMSFLILPEAIPIHNIQQRVLKMPRPMHYTPMGMMNQQLQPHFRRY